MNASRRDYRTLPGVLTPGYRCKKRPALKEQQIVAAESSCIYAGAGLPIFIKQNDFPSRIQNAFEKPAWHSMNDICGTDSHAAPSGQVVMGNGYQGLKPLAESCHPFGISPTHPIVQTDTFV